MTEPEDGYGPWTIWSLPDEEGEWKKRDTFDSADVACEMADEVMRVHHCCEVIVKDERGKRIYHIAS